MPGEYVINNMDFSPVIAPDGVRQLYIERRARSVVTMNGAKRSWSVPKRVLEFDLVAMTFERFRTYRNALGFLNGEVSVQYPDTDQGVVTKQFYFQDPGETFRSRTNRNVYLDKISFRLEEV